MNKAKTSLFYIMLLLTALLLFIISRNLSNDVVDIDAEKNYELVFNQDDNIEITGHKSEFFVGDVTDFSKPLNYHYVSNYSLKSNPEYIQVEDENDNLIEEQVDKSKTDLLLPISLNKTLFTTINSKNVEIKNNNLDVNTEYFLSSKPLFIDNYANGDISSMIDYDIISEYRNESFTVYNFSDSIYDSDSIIYLPEDSTILYTGFDIYHDNELTFDETLDSHYIIVLNDDTLDQNLSISEDLVYYSHISKLDSIANEITNNLYTENEEQNLDLVYESLLIKNEFYDNLFSAEPREFDLDFKIREDNILFALMTVDLNNPIQLTISYDAISGYRTSSQNPSFCFTSYKNTDNVYSIDGTYEAQLYSNTFTKYENVDLSPYWAYMNKQGYHLTLTNISPDVILWFSKTETHNSMSVPHTISTTIDMVLLPALAGAFLIRVTLDIKYLIRNKEKFDKLKKEIK